MTLPQNVKDAVKIVRKHFDLSMDDATCEAWCAVRAHLMSQDSEIDRRIADHSHMFVRAREWAELSGENERRANLAESRLAAANALLRRAVVGVAWGERDRLLPDIQTHLQGAGDEA